MKWTGSGNITELISFGDLLKEHTQLVGTGTTYQTLLEAYISTAGVYLEQLVGYPLRYTAVTVYYETDDCRQIILPKNINAISTYSYKDGDAWTSQTFATTPIRNDYRLYSELLSSEIKTNTLYKIVCTATVNASEPIKQACRMLVSEMFENRENKALKATGSTLNYSQSIEHYLQGEIAYQF